MYQKSSEKYQLTVLVGVFKLPRPFPLEKVRAKVIQQILLQHATI